MICTSPSNPPPQVNPLDRMIEMFDLDSGTKKQLFSGLKDPQNLAVHDG